LRHKPRGPVFVLAGSKKSKILRPDNKNYANRDEVYGQNKRSDFDLSDFDRDFLVANSNLRQTKILQRFPNGLPTKAKRFPNPGRLKAEAKNFVRRMKRPNL
jgi:hypothetical protein